jgi:hypothetical protein
MLPWLFLRDPLWSNELYLTTKVFKGLHQGSQRSFSTAAKGLLNFSLICKSPIEFKAEKNAKQDQNKIYKVSSKQKSKR